jgi:hypothetical protein
VRSSNITSIQSESIDTDELDVSTPKDEQRVNGGLASINSGPLATVNKRFSLSAYLSRDGEQ